MIVQSKKTKKNNPKKEQMQILKKLTFIFVKTLFFTEVKEICHIFSMTVSIVLSIVRMSPAHVWVGAPGKLQDTLE